MAWLATVIFHEHKTVHRYGGLFQNNNKNDPDSEPKGRLPGARVSRTQQLRSPAEGSPPCQVGGQMTMTRVKR